MGHLLHAIQLANLVKGVDAWRQTTVQAEDLVLNHSGKGKVVEQLSEDLPHVGVSVFAEALIVETIPIDTHVRDTRYDRVCRGTSLSDWEESVYLHLGDLAGFVVSAQNSNAILVAHLEGYKQGDGFHGVVAAIDVVSHEEVVGVGKLAANLE